MGCFFGCFRVRDARPPPIHLVAEPITSTTKEAVESQARNPLSSLLLFDAEGKDYSPCKDEKYHATGFPLPDFDALELKDEAKFLKACGTLSQTPAEIRRDEKLKDSTPHVGDSESLKFHSWLSNTTIQKLNLEDQLDQPPSPIGLCEEQMNESNSLAQSPSSCITGQDPSSMYTSSTEGCGVGNEDTIGNQKQNSAAPSVSFTPLVASVQCKNKSVRFDCQSDSSSFSSRSSSSNKNPKKFGPEGDNSVSKRSPYPTPLKLTDDMQTPGTVFPSNLHNQEIRMNNRIRSQYVYSSVLNPVENFSRLKALTEDSSSDHLREHLEQLQDYNETPKSEAGTRGSVVDKELNVETSLSSWLQPKATNQEVNNQCLSSTSQELAAFGKTPGDRPILGIVAAHWNEDEASRISPKWWDGNGIPNSTNKYKEDQKVSWHATPFEERLEKALSEDKLIAERKHLGGKPALDFDGDGDEECNSNSVVSQLPPLRQFKSAVSF